MFRFLLVIILAVCTLSACRKELSGHSDSLEAASINVSCDSEAIERKYPGHEPNDFSLYSFGSVEGMYFGYVTSFKVTEKENVEIRIGSLFSSDNELSSDEMINLIAPGKRVFGSLGAFTSYPHKQPGCAEIAYTDRDANRWSSTAITEKNTRYGVETTVAVNQPNAEFFIDSIRHIVVEDTLSRFQVSGHFRCRLYEVNGSRTKQMKGTFRGVVGSEN